jgi:hypothetical protein
LSRQTRLRCPAPSTRHSARRRAPSLSGLCCVMALITLSLTSVCACTSSQALQGDGIRAEQPQQFPPFDELELTHFLEAHILIASPEGEASAPRAVQLSLTGDSNLINAADLRILGRRLTISAASSLPPKVEPKLGVMVEGRVPNLDALTLRDTATGTVESVRNEEFRVSAFQASKFSLERVDNGRVLIESADEATGTAQGFTKQLTLVASGKTNVQAHRLRAQDAVIDLSDGATATVCVTGTLEVRLADESLLVKFCEPSRLITDALDSALLRDPTADEKRAAAQGAPRIDVRTRKRKQSPDEQDNADAPVKAPPKKSP